jgi:hypothetical protein
VRALHSNVDESQKDTIEYISAQVAAAVFELLPGGSLLSRALLVPVEVAERRRTTRILDSIAADIEQLQARADFPTVESLVASEAFMANLTETVRAMKATSNDEKRQLLRNALMNSELDDDPAELSEFLIRLVGRYSVLHVQMLRFIEPLEPFVSPEISWPVVDGEPSGVMRDLPAMLREAFPEDILLLDVVFQELRSDGLIRLSQPQTYTLQDTGDPTRPDSISELGREFVRFVRRPSGES